MACEFALDGRPERAILTFLDQATEAQQKGLAERFDVRQLSSATAAARLDTLDGGASSTGCQDWYGCTPLASRGAPSDNRRISVPRGRRVSAPAVGENGSPVPGSGRETMR